MISEIKGNAKKYTANPGGTAAKEKRRPEREAKREKTYACFSDRAAIFL